MKRRRLKTDQNLEEGEPPNGDAQQPENRFEMNDEAFNWL